MKDKMVTMIARMKAQIAEREKRDRARQQREPFISLLEHTYRMTTRSISIEKTTF